MLPKKIAIMDLVFENSYRKIYFEQAAQLIYVDWTPETAKMSVKEWENEMLITLKITDQYRPSHFLLDQTNLFFVLTPQLLHWTAEQLNKKWIEIGVKKVAVLLSQELMAKIPMKLMADDTKELHIPNQFYIRYFTNLEKAKAWILL